VFFSVSWLGGDVKETTGLSQRVGHVVPGVVVFEPFITIILKVSNPLIA